MRNSKSVSKALAKRRDLELWLGALDAVMAERNEGDSEAAQSAVAILLVFMRDFNDEPQVTLPFFYTLDSLSNSARMHIMDLWARMGRQKSGYLDRRLERRVKIVEESLFRENEFQLTTIYNALNIATTRELTITDYVRWETEGARLRHEQAQNSEELLDEGQECDDIGEMVHSQTPPERSEQEGDDDEREILISDNDTDIPYLTDAFGKLKYVPRVSANE